MISAAEAQHEVSLIGVSVHEDVEEVGGLDFAGGEGFDEEAVGGPIFTN